MVPVLQVKVGQELLDGFKERAGRQRLTMTELVVGWIEGYLSGGEGQAGGGSASSSGTSGTTSGSNDSEQYAALAARVSALEQALIALQGTSTTPHGGTVTQRASGSVFEGVSRVPEFKRPTPEELGYRAVREEEVLPGLAVWVKKWGRDGEVTEAPTMGVALVKEPGGTRMAQHVHVEQLFIAAPSASE